MPTRADSDSDQTAVMTAEELAEILAQERRIAYLRQAERARQARNAQARPRSCRDDR